MKRILFSIILFVATISVAFADEISFVTSAPNAVEVNQHFRLTYKINRGKVKEPKIAALDNFDILSGPNRSSSSSMSIINGKMTSEQSVTFTYILVATAEGTYTIPGATVTVDGEEITSNSVTIRVLPQESGSAQSSSSAASQQRSQAVSSQGGINNNELFMTATLNKAKVFEQEAVLLTYKIYSKVNLVSLNGKVPDLKGFQIQEVSLPQNKEFELEQYNGSTYRTLTWRQFVLFPQQSGEIEIPAVTFEGVVQQVISNTSMDPFEFFMNGGQRVVEVKKALTTKPLKLNVEKLPAGKPSTFSGAVGDFNVSATIDKNELKANEAVTLRLVISGTGNMKLIKTPEIQFPEDFELYDPKVSNNFTLKSNGFSGNKVIEYLAIPRHAGEYTIPAVKFSFFDTASKQYKSVETKHFTLNVAKGEGSSSESVASFVSKEELKLLGQDIRYLKQGNVTTNKRGDYFFASFTYILCYLLPALLFIIYIIVYRRQMKENANVTKMKTKKANKAAVKRLKLAKKLLAENKKNEFYDEILKALWGYTSDKLAIPVSRLTKDNVTDELSAIGVPAELIKELLDVLNEGEFARYAPGDASAAMDKLYAMSMNVISKMENFIKR
ncbi:MAG: protein BatD [Bacteroidaceae bacterium]|nr:protein BatD [Bacteroidaceae bacterium]